jgi:hypothetical protein
MKTKIAIPLILLMITGFMLTGCYAPWIRIEGNMNVVTETRVMPEFDRVHDDGNFDVYVIQDSLSEVVIEAESNLIPLIRTRIQGSALVIDTKDNLRNNYPMKIYVHTTDISEMKLSGSGLMHAEDINTEDFEADVSGSGDLLITGTAHDVNCSISGSGSMEIGLSCDQIEADISGSGEVEIYGTASQGDFHISGSGSIHAYELALQQCHANISGSGSMYLNVEDYLYVKISGSGDVYYMGSPVIETDINGSGSVIHP